MNGGTVLVVGLGGIIAYVAYSMSGYDPYVFNMPAEQARTALANAFVEVPYVSGKGTYTIRGGTSTIDSVELTTINDFDDSDSTSNSGSSCFARLAPISESKVKVVADCSTETSGTSAIEANLVEIREATHNEFIQSTLRKRAFDAEGVRSKQIGAVLRNNKAMNQEALQRSDEAQALEAQ
jgi:hypothetical protein